MAMAAAKREKRKKKCTAGLTSEWTTETTADE